MIDEEIIDQRYWVKWTDDDPWIKPERANKPDMRFEVDCPKCDAAGALEGRKCDMCRGKKRLPDGRLKRGEIISTSEIQYAQAVVLNILNWLGDKKHISKQNLFDGNLYGIWREVAHAQYGGHRRDSLYQEARGMSESVGLSEYGFILVLQRLSRADLTNIEKAIDETQRQHSIYLAEKFVHQYQSAFARLSDVIEEVGQKLDAMRSAGKQEPISPEEALKMLADKMGIKKKS